MALVRVETGAGQYEVCIEAGLLERAKEAVSAALGERKLFVIADEIVWGCLGSRLAAGLEGTDWTLLSAPLGEQRKDLGTVGELCRAMHRAGADRASAVIAFGGGVAGDVGGFVAACYMRGIDAVQVPTTLLAQVDASVGGKTGVNLPSGKNLVGAFHQPCLVLVDPTSLETLPDREYRAGLLEVVKHGVIRSADLFEFMESSREAALGRAPEAVERMIAESVRIKAEVVRADERESGLRRILNFGHTLGHALEAETGYRRLLHGEAVAFGMVAAAKLSELVGRLAAPDRDRIEQLVLDCVSMPGLEGVSAEALAARTSGDKKALHGKLRFVVADGIGQAGEVTDPPEGLLVQAAEHALSACQARAAAAG